MDPRVPPELDDLRLRARAFVERECIPAEARAGREEPDGRVVEELRAKARSAGLWAPHLPRAWGGLGLGAVGMALVSQELGASPLAPLALNCSAPDEGNMHALLRFGSPEQQERYLRPLAEGRARSCFAMTEPAAGSDPRGLRTRARREGDGYALDGDKWFVTGARGAAFAIVVAVHEDASSPREAASLFLVDADAPGFTVVRDIPVMGTHAPGGHCEVRLRGVRVGEAAILGGRGRGFEVAQDRLGLGRVGHAMRWIGAAQRALDLAAGRALERETFGQRLADRQAVQWMIAESATELHLARLAVLDAAWRIDEGLPHKQQVAMVKVFVAQALQRIVDRALQIHGALGYSADLPLERLYRDARAARIYDGPDEVHLASIAKQALRAQRTEGSTRSAAGGA
jgi:acyl-CoA dehydrogenase